ncbi:hypothetical protein H9P43_010060 [Blastocladiella emersonii ATCC 22665]|nr:hypothetical protein H9P43_010060 [Blastocladiella emersonii ATCC 22665]
MTTRADPEPVSAPLPVPAHVRAASLWVPHHDDAGCAAAAPGPGAVPTLTRPPVAYLYLDLDLDLGTTGPNTADSLRAACVWAAAALPGLADAVECGAAPEPLLVPRRDWRRSLTRVLAVPHAAVAHWASAAPEGTCWTRVAVAAAGPESPAPRVTHGGMAGPGWRVAASVVDRSPSLEQNEDGDVGRRSLHPVVAVTVDPPQDPAALLACDRPALAWYLPAAVFLDPYQLSTEQTTAWRVYSGSASAELEAPLGAGTASAQLVVVPLDPAARASQTARVPLHTRYLPAVRVGRDHGGGDAAAEMVAAAAAAVHLPVPVVVCDDGALPRLGTTPAMSRGGGARASANASVVLHLPRATADDAAWTGPATALLVAVGALAVTAAVALPGPSAARAKVE